MSVALSTTVTEVSVTLRACHMVTSLCTLDMNLQTEVETKGRRKMGGKKVTVVCVLFTTHRIGKELHALSWKSTVLSFFQLGTQFEYIIMFSSQTHTIMSHFSSDYCKMGTISQCNTWIVLIFKLKSQVNSLVHHLLKCAAIFMQLYT